LEKKIEEIWNLFLEFEQNFESEQILKSEQIFTYEHFQKK
jgi:hypothetical protein